MRHITDDVLAVGAVDWDRELFDELIPLPEGTTYNAYLVKGSQKTALLDSVDPARKDVLVDNILKAGIDKIDYIVAHHGEQDHSGTIPDLLVLYPEAKVVVNEKCKGMLARHLHLEDDVFEVIDEGDKISLGNKTLEFINTPWVHWPETFSTYLHEEKILFSCDFFGSHYATSDLFVTDESVIYHSAKRYYAEIMMPFRTAIQGNMKKVEKFDIEMIAPSHGPIYNRPGFIMDAYRDWISDEVKNEVVLPFVSMHDSTRHLVDYFIDSLIEREITVKPFNLTRCDIGELAMALVDAATVVIGSPTVLVGAHPSAAYAAFLTNALRPKFRYMSIIGSFGWGSKMVDQLSSLLPNIKAEVIEPVLVKGDPEESGFAELDKLADTILAKHRGINIVE